MTDELKSLRVRGSEHDKPWHDSILANSLQHSHRQRGYTCILSKKLNRLRCHPRRLRVASFWHTYSCTSRNGRSVGATAAPWYASRKRLQTGLFTTPPFNSRISEVLQMSEELLHPMIASNVCRPN